MPAKKITTPAELLNRQITGFAIKIQELLTEKRFRCLINKSCKISKSYTFYQNYINLNV